VEVVDAGQEIKTLMGENRKLFYKSKDGKTDCEDEEWLMLWRDYEDYVDDIVSKCLQQAIGCR